MQHYLGWGREVCGPDPVCGLAPLHSIQPTGTDKSDTLALGSRGHSPSACYPDLCKAGAIQRARILFAYSNKPCTHVRAKTAQI